MNEDFYLDYKEKGVTKEAVTALAGRMHRKLTDALSAAEQGQPYAMAARVGEAIALLDQYDIFFGMLMK